MNARTLFTSIQHSIEHRAQRFSSKPFWELKLAVLATLLSLFTAFPSYDLAFAGGFSVDWRDLLEQTEHPFTPNPAWIHDDPVGYFHHGSLAFRLTVPVIGNLLHLGMTGFLVLQILALLATFYFVNRAAYKASRDAVTTVFITLGYALIFAGNVLCSDVRGMFDSITLLLLVSAMAVDSPLAIFILMFLAAFTDERALVASPLLFIYGMKTRGAPSFTLGGRAMAFALGVVAYVVARIVLGKTLGLTVSLFPFWTFFLEQINVAFVGALTALEGFWGLVIVSFVTLLAARRRTILAAYVLCLGLLLVASVGVRDVTRAMGYAIPAIFISLSLIADEGDVRLMRTVSLISAGCCLFPTYYVGGRNLIYLYSPLPFHVLRIFVLHRSWLYGFKG